MIDRKEFMKSCAAAFCAAGVSCAAQSTLAEKESQPDGACEQNLVNIKGKLETGPGKERVPP